MLAEVYLPILFVKASWPRIGFLCIFSRVGSVAAQPSAESFVGVHLCACGSLRGVRKVMLVLGIVCSVNADISIEISPKCSCTCVHLRSK